MEDSDYPTCERTYVTLRIYPQIIDPSEVTARLGIEPSKWQRRGESSAPGASPPKLHGWFLSSDRSVDSCDNRKHLDWLITQIAPQAGVLRGLQDEECKMDVSCFWVSRSGHGGPSIRPAQMQALAALNLELWFDVFLGGA